MMKRNYTIKQQEQPIQQKVPVLQQRKALSSLPIPSSMFTYTYIFIFNYF